MMGNKVRKTTFERKGSFAQFVSAMGIMDQTLVVGNLSRYPVYFVLALVLPLLFLTLCHPQGSKMLTCLLGC